MRVVKEAMFVRARVGQGKFLEQWRRKREVMTVAQVLISKVSSKSV
jgi:hypothetical protein